MTRTRHGSANRLLIVDADELSAEKVADAARSVGFEVAFAKELTHKLHIQARAERVDEKASSRTLEAMGFGKIQGITSALTSRLPNSKRR